MKKSIRFWALLVLTAMCITLFPPQTNAASESDLQFSIYGNGYRVDKCNGSAKGSLTIPGTYNGLPVTHIRTQAFEYCSGLTEVIISDGVQFVGDFAFYGCSNLVSVTLPDSVQGINKAAFKDCSKLANITIPSKVSRITESAFYNCDGLTSISIPDNVHYIETCAFQYCNNLVSITLPDSWCYIASWAFDGCSKLTSINIPDGMTKIDQYTFSNCRSLTRVTIPDTVTTIAHHAFNGCSKLTEVIYCGTEEQWDKITIDGYNENLTQATLRYHDWVGTGSQKTCTVCQMTSDGHEHVWKPATCTKPKTCTVCALTEGSVAEHSYDAGVVTKPATCKEEGSKIRTCTVCSATKNEAISKLTTHTYSNVCDTSCDVCGQNRTVKHDYQAAWTSDSTYHWHKCSICNNKSDTGLHVPGTAATATTPQTCTVCGYVIAPALGAQETKPTTPPTTTPSTQPATQPSTAPVTEPSTPEITAPTTQPLTESTTLPPTSAEPVPEQSEASTGISVVQMLLIMLAEAAILCGIFLLFKKKKR